MTYKIQYIGNYYSGGRIWKYCFQVSFSNHLIFHDHIYIWGLNELIEDNHLHYLLEPALAACNFIPDNLTLKEKIAFLQLGC